jgi:hypothetical protein
MDWRGRLLLVLLSHRRCCLCYEVMLTQRDFPSRTGFYCLQTLYKWRIWYCSSPWRGRCCLMFTSSRYSPWPPFSLNKFLILTINFTVITNGRLWVIIRQYGLQICVPNFQTCSASLAQIHTSCLQIRHWEFRFSAWVAILAPSTSQLIVLILPCSH